MTATAATRPAPAARPTAHRAAPTGPRRRSAATVAARRSAPAAARRAVATTSATTASTAVSVPAASTAPATSTTAGAGALLPSPAAATAASTTAAATVASTTAVRLVTTAVASVASTIAVRLVTTAVGSVASTIAVRLVTTAVGSVASTTAVRLVTTGVGSVASTTAPARDDRGGERRFDDRRPARDDRVGERRFDDRRPARDDRTFGDRRPARDDRRSDDRPRRDERQRSFDDRPRRDSTYYPSAESKPFAPKEDVVLERLEAQATRAEDIEGVTFADLGLGTGIAGALKSMGAPTPFPIQAATIPDVLAGRDVLGRGRTGSGKTIAFGAPIIELLMRNRPERREIGRPPRAIILAPTRELAQQINHTVMGLGRAVGIFTTVIVGGVKQDRQVEALRRGVDIVIGTAGRIEDLVEQGRLNLGGVEIAVVDEADHMCELGFLEPVQRILRGTRPGSQKLLFSATLDSEVATIVREFLPTPAVHEVAGEDQATSTIEHQVLVADRFDKDAVLEQIVRNPGRIIVFTRTRAYAERLAEQFDDAGIEAASLHGDLNQSQRNRALEKLRRGKIDVLVATDVAARGIHIDDVALVVQADPPDEYKTYLHRSGRTGRAGNNGRVVTVIAPARRKRMQDLLQRAEIKAPMIPVRPASEILETLTVPPVSPELELAATPAE